MLNVTVDDAVNAAVDDAANGVWIDAGSVSWETLRIFHRIKYPKV